MLSLHGQNNERGPEILPDTMASSEGGDQVHFFSEQNAQVFKKTQKAKSACEKLE